MACAAIAGTVYFWLTIFRPFLILDRDHLEYRNSTAVRRIRYADVQRVFVGYFGVRVLLREGSVQTVNAVVKNNFAKVLRYRTVGDEIVAEIERRARLH